MMMPIDQFIFFRQASPKQLLPFPLYWQCTVCMNKKRTTFFTIKKPLPLHRKSKKEKPRFIGFIFPQNMKYGKRYANNKVAHCGADEFPKISG
jgi:hypothetical protein